MPDWNYLEEQVIKVDGKKVTIYFQKTSGSGSALNAIDKVTDDYYTRIGPSSPWTKDVDEDIDGSRRSRQSRKRQGGSRKRRRGSRKERRGSRKKR
jgi:hypothetical protein